MNLNELFERLALGELSQHKFGTNGSISEKDSPAVISHINQALTALHSRFPLQHKELLIKQFDHITDYKLDIAYAVSNTTSTEDKYIIDTEEEPFLDDLIRIQAAYDGAGINVPLNDEYLEGSWFTPNPDTIQIPFPVMDNMSVIMYRSNHPKIPLNTSLVDAENITIELPQCLEPALGAYVAWRSFIALGNQSSAQLSAFYRNLYNEEVNMIEAQNLLQSSTTSTNFRFFDKGFV